MPRVLSPAPSAGPTPWLQPVSLQQHLVSRHVRPATARASPGVLDLCLVMPPSVSELRLRLDFSKAFLTAFEYPPDAHRGFDVPAALVSYLDPLALPTAQWREGGGGEGQPLVSPLLLALQGSGVQQVCVMWGTGAVRVSVQWWYVGRRPCLACATLLGQLATACKGQLHCGAWSLRDLTSILVTHV